jgi:hypothetical protein
MAQINLLKQKTPLENFWQFLPGLVAKLLLVGFLVLVGYYLWQFRLLSQANQQISDDQQAIARAESSVAGITNRDEIYTRQAQLQQLNGLIGKHIYWSTLFPVLAKATLKKAAYSTLSANKDGSIILSVAVPDLESMDKFIQVFNQPEYYANFMNLRVGAFTKVAVNGKPGYSFDARMSFNPALLEAATEPPKANP